MSGKRQLKGDVPFRYPLTLHIGAIVLGLALFQAVRQVASPSRDQVIIPEMATISARTICGWGVSWKNSGTRSVSR